MRIALTGNPNSGKTTMYNALTGRNEKVGNWAGVTVEKKEHPIKKAYYGGEEQLIAVDLPGAYSMSPFTSEESITSAYVKHENPDVIINIVDATNLSRSLFFTTQLLELGIPVVVALNKSDINEKKDTKIDVDALSAKLGCPVIRTVSTSAEGLKAVVETAVARANESQLAPYSEGNIDLTDKKAVENADRERFDFVNKIVSKVETRKVLTKDKNSDDRIDAVLTNPVAGILIFAGIMFLVFQISQAWVGPLIADTLVAWLETFQAWVGTLLENANPLLSALLVDGVIGGVSAVIGFLPLVMVMYFLIALLEDCGYMARVAFIMDRVFRRFGLSGKSFIPMLVSSGCGVPGVMATKTIENEKDRRMTVMTTTFIPCGAKLPIIALLMGSIIGDSSTTAAWISPLFYFLGVFAVIASGLMLKKTKLFAGRPTPFVMELPAYHFPAIRSWALHVWERCWAFIKKAGTIIFASTVVVWFLSNFGSYNGSFGFLPAMDGIPEEFMDYSVLAMLGNLVAWIFAPLGFSTWQATALTVSGLVAKENVVATAGSLLSVADAGETDPSLWTAFAGMFPTMGACVAFGAFNLLCAPCFAAMGTIRNQMDSGKWTAIALGYECAFAWVIGLFINQFYNLLVLGQFGFWTVVAIVLLVAMLFQIFRPMPKHAWTDEDETNTASAAVSA